MMIRVPLLLAAALASPAIAAPQHAVHHTTTANVTDWSRVTNETAAGGVVMGNPNAKVKLVEYGSLTCPHCRHFDEEASAPLIANYVKSGKVSWEFRSFLLNGYDIPATLTARCNGAASFFPMLHALYAAQPDWIAKMQGLSKERMTQIEAMPTAQQFVAIGQGAGFPAFAAAHGIPAARVNACLGNGAAAKRAVEVTETAAKKFNVTYTPTFIVNGAMVDYSAGPSVWGVVEARLKAALAS